MSNAEMLINAFMTSRLDYCNSSLGGWLHYCPSLSLRSQNSVNLIKPRISKSTVGGRSFFSAQTLNQPRIVREADTLCQFKSRLKTHVFNLAYTLHLHLHLCI